MESMNEISDLLADIARPDSWVEFLSLVVCLVLAYALCRVLNTVLKKPQNSVWFGRNILDGLMFPLLALTLTYAANYAVGRYQHLSVLKVAVPVLMSLVAIRLIARTLTLSFPASGWARLTERLFSWVAWALAIFWIIGLLPGVLEELDAIKLAFGKGKVSLRTILEGLLSAGLVLIVTLWISSALERHVLRDAVEDLSMRKIMANGIRALLILFGMLFALSAVGVDLTALSVLGGALGVGLGFGLQKLAANYVSGFVILFERSVRIGDSVKVDGFEGRVSDIKTRYTLIRALNGREAIIPNEKMITERVENLSLADPKVLLSSVITVGYGSDVMQVQSLLCKAALGNTRVLADPEPVAHLTQFAADGLEFTLLFWISDPDNGQMNVKSQINVEILAALRATEIEIPYPQRVVQLRADPALAATPVLPK
jgi:small-conductance mechanosensitive channel